MADEAGGADLVTRASPDSAGGGVPGAVLGPSVLARLLPLVYIFNGAIGLANTETWPVNRVLSGTLFVAGIAVGVSLQFASLSVDADGITHRWFRTKRWRWDELTGLGWRMPHGHWVFRPTDGRWRYVARWVKLCPTSRRQAVCDFSDALQQAARTAGVPLEAVPPWAVSIWR
jgi:hypothetical protein